MDKEEAVAVEADHEQHQAVRKVYLLAVLHEIGQ